MKIFEKLRSLAVAAPPVHARIFEGAARAAGAGDAEALADALRLGVVLNETEAFEPTLLHYAAEASGEGGVECVKLLLACGANPRATAAWTRDFVHGPAWWAAKRDNWASAGLLIDAGFDVDADLNALLFESFSGGRLDIAAKLAPFLAPFPESFGTFWTGLLFCQPPDAVAEILEHFAGLGHAPAGSELESLRSRLAELVVDDPERLPNLSKALTKGGADPFGKVWDGVFGKWLSVGRALNEEEEISSSLRVATPSNPVSL